MENLLCIGVDGRKKTHYTTRNQWRKIKLKFWKKPKDLMSLDNHKGDTKWEYIFDSLGSSWYWCNWYTIKAVLVDNTNANTGCEGGLATLLEKKIKRNLHTIGCSLHRNELPFRALFKHLDGTTKSHTTFNGPLCKLCANDCHNLPQNLFQLLRIPWSFILEWKIWIPLVVTKEYSMNIQLVFLEVRWTLDLHRGKLVH